MHKIRRKYGFLNRYFLVSKRGGDLRPISRPQGFQLIPEVVHLQDVDDMYTDATTHAAFLGADLRIRCFRQT